MDSFERKYDEDCASALSALDDLRKLSRELLFLDEKRVFDGRLTGGLFKPLKQGAQTAGGQVFVGAEGDHFNPASDVEKAPADPPDNAIHAVTVEVFDPAPARRNRLAFALQGIR